MKNFHHYLVFLIFVLASCATGTNYSTPENTYNSIRISVQQKNFNSFKQGFSTKNQLYTDKNLKILFSNLINDTKIYSHKILKKEVINQNSVNLLVEEKLIKRGKKSKTKYKINYIKIGKSWKALDSEIIEIVVQ